MSDTQTRTRPGKALKYILWGLLLSIVVGTAGFFMGQKVLRDSQQNAELDTVVVESRLALISELATTSYQYTNMGQFSSSSDFYGVTIPFTTKSFILSYDGEIKAGVDLSRAEVKVLGNMVSVSLPAARVLSHEIHEESIRIFDEKTSIFNPFTVEDFASFQVDQKAEMERKALERGLLGQAEVQAENSVRSLLTPLLEGKYALSVSAGG